MDLLHPCLDTFSTNIEGFVDVESYKNTEQKLFIPISFFIETLPDYRGNFITFKEIRLFTPERNNQFSCKCEDQCYTFHTRREKWKNSYFYKLPFFSYNSNSISSNFIKVHNYRHPRFSSYYPITSLNFNNVYKGYNLNRAITYIKNTKTLLFEKSFYKGPGKDEKYYKVQKLIFKEPENINFFSDILQLFEINWYSENTEDKVFGSIVSSEGPGFYRKIEDYLAYSSQFNWKQVKDTKSTNDILQWMKMENTIPTK